MTTPGPAFTPTDLLVAASSVLGTNGYHTVALRAPQWQSHSNRLFEDPYSVVGVSVFDTVDSLLQDWPDLQGSLVDVISHHIGRDADKAWDGYLVLLTPAAAASRADELESLRNDTTRLRKLVATGEDLQEASDVERTLRSLLPLSRTSDSIQLPSTLDLLPNLLTSLDIPASVTTALIDTYRDQGSMLERLHKIRSAP
ncbi:MAG: hypothetical protein H6812_00200 [Phycisphaeraceae bacterium]|nr:hypothetical protein [Phycisphaeraceae bacterium]